MVNSKKQAGSKLTPPQKKETVPSSPPPFNDAEYPGKNYDRMFHALLSEYGGWLSPAILMVSFTDWLCFLLLSPAKQQNLINDTFKKLQKFMLYLYLQSTNKPNEPPVSVPRGDHRFQHELWGQFPFNMYSQGFLLMEQWWDEATLNLHGVSKHHENIVNFVTRQCLDMFSPSNSPMMNPELIDTSIKQGGDNFTKGFNNFIEDIINNLNEKPPIGCEQFEVGVNLAVTPGKVIYRNRLIELIQYSPTTKDVYAEPILIVPAWIMKYYILDLSPHNSMVKFLVDKGHTVFMISWKNPGSEDRDLSMADYLDHGVMDAIDAIGQIVPNQKIHAAGYCIGGTLLAIAAARMAYHLDDRLKTMTLFAAQIDFEDAGELRLFIDENQITYLEDIMWEKGYLDGSQMAGAFSMLRSIDLIWSRVIRDYLFGSRQPVNDLMAWDYDTTRMPYKMHVEYLRDLFLNNDLVEGRFKINNDTVNLGDINVPTFVVSTLKDHVAPWKSVYKIHNFTETDLTYVLTNAGHNTGIVNEPGQPGRSFQMLDHRKQDIHHSPEIWQEKAPHYEGSWWLAWESWLGQHSEGKTKPPSMGNVSAGLKVLCSAPGTYVHQR